MNIELCILYHAAIIETFLPLDPSFVFSILNFQGGLDIPQSIAFARITTPARGYNVIYRISAALTKRNNMVYRQFLTLLAVCTTIIVSCQ